MDLTSFAKSLSLPADASDADCLLAITKLSGECEAARTSLATLTEAHNALDASYVAASGTAKALLDALGAPSVDAALGTLAGLKEKAERCDAVCAELETQKAAARKAEVDHRIQKAKDDGKLTPKSEAFARAQCAVASDPLAWLDAYVESLPVALPGREDKTQASAGADLGGKTWEQLSNVEKADLFANAPETYAALRAARKQH